jgi:hypothetical protein
VANDGFPAALLAIAFNKLQRFQEPRGAGFVEVIFVSRRAVDRAAAFEKPASAVAHPPGVGVV